MEHYTSPELPDHAIHWVAATLQKDICEARVMNHDNGVGYHLLNHADVGTRCPSVLRIFNPQSSCRQHHHGRLKQALMTEVAQGLSKVNAAFPSSTSTAYQATKVEAFSDLQMAFMHALLLLPDLPTGDKVPIVQRAAPLGTNILYILKELVWTCRIPKQHKRPKPSRSSTAACQQTLQELSMAVDM